MTATPIPSGRASLRTSPRAVTAGGVPGSPPPARPLSRAAVRRAGTRAAPRRGRSEAGAAGASAYLRDRRAPRLRFFPPGRQGPQVPAVQVVQARRAGLEHGARGRKHPSRHGYRPAHPGGSLLAGGKWQQPRIRLWQGRMQQRSKMIVSRCRQKCMRSPASPSEPEGPEAPGGPRGPAGPREPGL